MAVSRKIEVVGSYLSPFVRKVLAAVTLKEVSYEIDPINPFFANDEFRKLSPLGRVPLVFHEKVVLCDSTVICEYLDEVFPDSVALYPPATKSLVDRANARLCEELGDTRFADVLIWQLWFELAIAKGLWGKEPDMSIVKHTLEVDIPKLLSFMTENLLLQLPSSKVREGGYLFGETITMGDIGLCVSFRNMEYLKYDIRELYEASHPLAVSYIERVIHHPCLESLKPFEEASLRGKTSERRQQCIVAGAPVSSRMNFGTLATPRGWND